MEKLEVIGSKKLKGDVKISGSKNASLPILAATLLSNKKIKILNLPKVKDIETMILLLSSLGSHIKLSKNNNSIDIDNSKNIRTFASYNLVKTMRAGILVLGPLLARFGKAKVSLPGGCAIGARPVDVHLKAFSKLGVKYKIINGYIYAKAPKGLIGNIIKFSKISVGATENLIIAACLANGKTTLKNCAIEPEIKDLINFLRKMGCKIKWIGKRTLTILGIKNLKNIKYQIMFDRIEAGTYLIASALTSGNLRITNINPKIINTEINILKKIGVKIKIKSNEIFVRGTKNVKNIKIKTSPYPGFPTDLQAQLMVLLCKANGRSEIVEKIFENRFMHVAELNRMGAKIKISGSKAIIEGNINFNAAELMATDLRASVSLILAALSAKGKSIINRIYHLDRGYEQIEKKLQKVGANIKRISK
jgi:UDP-N-acetylglucosamine 1-carboxyvinyltransferase